MKRNDSFLIFCVLAIVLILIVFGIKIIMKETNASFGGVTGSFGNSTKVVYHSNWPDSSMEAKTALYEGSNSYKILPNMFDVPDGYEFSGWSLYSNGPVLYRENQYIEVSFDMNFYAIWEETLVEVLAYGDVNQNGLIDENDYILIDNYILDNSMLSGQALINADVNTDGKVDVVDSDIVKQVFLGTEGYVGILPNSPILIYELYEDIKDKEDSDESTEDGDNVTDNKPGVVGGGNGSGSSGTGSGSSGNGTASSSGGNSNGSSGNTTSGNITNNDSSKEDDINNSKEEDVPLIYNFKFMNGDMEYAKTTCGVLKDMTCLLVLPKTIPSKSGYKFDGWSIDSDCSKDIIKDSISVTSGNTYFACYSLDYVENEENNSFSEWIVVILIWLLAIFGIYRVIINFKQKSN